MYPNALRTLAGASLAFCTTMVIAGPPSPQCQIEPLGELLGGDDLRVFDAIPADGVVYFRANADDSSSAGFVASDGTPGGTVYSPFPDVIEDEDGYVTLGSSLYFVGRPLNGGFGGKDLWRMTADGQLTNIDPLVPSDPDETPRRFWQDLRTDGMFIYYVGLVEGTTGTQRTLYMTNGEPGGTIPVQPDVSDEDVGPRGPVFDMTVLNGKLIYTGSAVDSTSTNNVWVWDGSSHTIINSEIPNRDVDPMIVAEDIIYFNPNSELWRSDGTPGGTYRVSGDGELVSIGGGSLVSGNGLYYNRSGQLWYTDGTADSLRVVADETFALYGAYNGAVLLGGGNPRQYYVSAGGSTPVLLTELAGLDPDFFGTSGVGNVPPMNFEDQGLVLPGETMYLTDLSARAPDVLCGPDGVSFQRFRGAFWGLNGALVGVISTRGPEPIGRMDFVTALTPSPTPGPTGTPTPTPTITPTATPTPSPTPLPLPGEFALISPGTTTSIEAPTVIGTFMTFEWEASTNAEDYTVICNLSSGSLFTKTVTENSLTIAFPDSIKEDEPHSWFVIARNETGPRTSMNSLFFLKESEIFDFLQGLLGEKDPDPLSNYDTNGDGVYDAGDVMTELTGI